MTSFSNFEHSGLPSVTLVRTITKISEKQLFSHRRCYIGISLDSPVFQGKSLHAVLFWAVNRFDRVLVMIGDYLCRFNEHIFRGLNDDQAANVTKNLGDSFIHKTRRLFQQLPDGKIQLTRWKQHLQTNEYKQAKAILDQLFADDADFHASVQKDAVSFVARQRKRNQKLAVQTEEAIKISSEYILEEIAVFSALSKQGWHVELYPGPELQVLEDIAKCKHTAVPTGLKQRVNVELRISQNSSNGL